MTPTGFPHSEIHGSKLASSSPWLFAGNRVLHRLLVPRHPPCALSSLNSSSGLHRNPRCRKPSLDGRTRGFVRNLTNPGFCIPKHFGCSYVVPVPRASSDLSGNVRCRPATYELLSIAFA